MGFMPNSTFSHSNVNMFSEERAEKQQASKLDEPINVPRETHRPSFVVC